MEKVKIYIATPMYGGQCHGEYTDSLIKHLGVIADEGWSAEYRFMYNESLITRARDTLACTFLQSDSTHLLFIDADVGMPAEVLPAMVKADVDVIGGLYPLKHINWARVADAACDGVGHGMLRHYGAQYVFNVKAGEDPTLQSIDIKQVQETGTGYMLIKRDVFDRLHDRTESYKLNGISGRTSIDVKAFFKTSIDPEDGVLLSEDYHFCREVNRIGGKVFVAPWARAKHFGTYEF